MEKITIGQVAVAVAFLAALIAGGVKIKDTVKKWLENLLKEKFDAVKSEQEKIMLELSVIRTDQKKIDLENCKNYLVTYLASVERGDPKDEIEKERFWEEFSHYIDTGGNSYIKEKVQALRSKGLI